MTPRLEEEIRTAERALEAALQGPDPTAWVDCYTEDAVFVGPSTPAVHGREELLQMARAMTPLSSVSIVAERTEASGELACVYGRGSWVNGRPPNEGATTDVRFLIVWRRETDGAWRVSLELLNAGSESPS